MKTIFVLSTCNFSHLINLLLLMRLVSVYSYDASYTKMLEFAVSTPIILAQILSKLVHLLF